MNESRLPLSQDQRGWLGKAGSDSAPVTHTADIKGRIFELAAEVARLVCVEDVAHVDDREGRKRLDLAANEIGFLLKLPEPEFSDLWRAEKAAR